MSCENVVELLANDLWRCEGRVNRCEECGKGVELVLV